MKKWWEQLKEEYYETRFDSNEDWMEWFIKRKMTWGWRWPTAITILSFGLYHFQMLEMRFVSFIFIGAGSSYGFT